MRGWRPYPRLLTIAVVLFLAAAARPRPSAAALDAIDLGTVPKSAQAAPGELVTLRAIQGLVNRDRVPSIFILLDRGMTHDRDWLNVLSRKYHVSIIAKPVSARPIDDLVRYINKFRSDFAGYVLFDIRSSRSGGPSANLALSLAGILNAIPIDRNDGALIAAARNADLRQLDDVSDKDYEWLKASRYWPSFNRDAVYFNEPSGPGDGADFAVSLRMAVFWDDVRSDPEMRTMALMLGDQRPGGVVYGWGHTDARHGEDIFVGVASRRSQSLMDIPSNLSVYRHYPLRQPLKNSPTPALPTGARKHYAAFVYSDGDNPRVIFNSLTLPGNDRYESPLRGKFPIGWTLPPTIADLAGPLAARIYAAATPQDEFLAGPSGYGYAFPSLMPRKSLFAAETQRAMARMDLHDVLVLDTDGKTGFSRSALDPLTAEPNVRSVFFAAFNGRDQPGPGTVLWSNGKPVLPAFILYRPAGHGNTPIADRTASYLNARPRDATSPAGYTLVYVDFWSVSMTDLDQIVSRLDPDVVVVRPDVLAAMARAHIQR